jgi:DNA-binding NarL/FixJ family response regulator
MQSLSTPANSSSRLCFVTGITRLIVVSPSAPLRGQLQGLVSDAETVQVVGSLSGAEELKDWLFWDRSGWNLAVVDSRADAEQVVADLNREQVPGRIIVLVDALTPNAVEKYLALGVTAVVEKGDTAALRDRLSTAW